MSATPSTLFEPVSATQEIRKSKFIAHAAPVDTPDEALAFLQRVADAQATHNCWAYRIGQHYRFSDDGEPGGTAGKPILQAIEGQVFDHVVVVVTRWFGGVKLGAGGLVRAYGGCAAECLRNAPRRRLVRKIEIDCHAPFAALPMLNSRLGDYDADKLSERFDADGACCRLALPAEQLEPLRTWLADLTRGRATIKAS